MSVPASQNVWPEYELSYPTAVAPDVPPCDTPPHRASLITDWRAPSTLAWPESNLFSRLQRGGKRALDLFSAGVGLLVMAPVMAMVALVIVVDSPGPVFYRTYRVGKRGRFFRFYKFRTMIDNADELLDEVRDMNGGNQILIKFQRDPRVTRVGQFLRRHSLDELPQLWNVLRGDMSMVGPRPTSLSEHEQLQGGQLRRTSVPPGLTGLWQVTARRDPSFERYTGLDCQYVDQWSLWLDIRILFKTIPAVVLGTGQ